MVMLRNIILNCLIICLGDLTKSFVNKYRINCLIFSWRFFLLLYYIYIEMAYLGNHDLGESLQLGGSTLYDTIYDDFKEKSQNTGGSFYSMLHHGKEYKPHRMHYGLPIFGNGQAKSTDIEKMGEHLGRMMLEQNPELKGSGVVTGGSFWNNLKKGFMKAVKVVAPIVKKVAPIVAPGYGTLLSTGLSLAGLGKKRKTNAKTTKKPKTKRPQSEKQKQRGQMVSQLMREEGMTLPEASKYIKANNLI